MRIWSFSRRSVMQSITFNTPGARFRQPAPSIGASDPRAQRCRERRESETCCEAPGRVSAAAVESGGRRTDELF